MLVWRITLKQHEDEAFSGMGASLHPGRWNRLNFRAVYAAEHLSLAALEFFMHVNGAERHMKLVSRAAELPERSSPVEIKPEELPHDWRSYPAPPSLRELATRALLDNDVLFIKVPSVVIPVEHNVIINPLHRDFRSAKVRKAEPFSFDPRMWKR